MDTRAHQLDRADALKASDCGRGGWRRPDARV